MRVTYRLDILRRKERVEEKERLKMRKPKTTRQPKEKKKIEKALTEAVDLSGLDYTEVFDCTSDVRQVTRKQCVACPYFMTDISFIGCGYLFNGKRGGGIGEDRYIKNKPQ